MPERLFVFIQLEFPWALGPTDGRYLLRAGGGRRARAGDRDRRAGDARPGLQSVQRAAARAAGHGGHAPRAGAARSALTTPDPAPVRPTVPGHRCRSALAFGRGTGAGVASRSLDREREVRGGRGDPQPRPSRPPDRLGRPLTCTRGRGRPGAGDQSRLGRGRAGLADGAAGCTPDELSPIDRPPGPDARRATWGRSWALRPHRSVWPPCSAGASRVLLCEEKLVLRARLDLDNGRSTTRAWPNAAARSGSTGVRRRRSMTGAPLAELKRQRGLSDQDLLLRVDPSCDQRVRRAGDGTGTGRASRGERDESVGRQPTSLRAHALGPTIRAPLRARFEPAAHRV